MNIPDPMCTKRAWCLVCVGHQVESMEHILTECLALERAAVWDLCRRVWLKKWPFWPTLELETILECSLTEFKDDGTLWCHLTLPTTSLRVCLPYMEHTVRATNREIR